MIRGSVTFLVKAAFNLVGLDVRRLPSNPRHNALGMRTMGIRTVIDVGANTGQFARYIRSVLPDATILCFEPLPGPFAELRTWAEKQKDGPVRVFNLALGECDSTLEMFQHVDHSPSSSLLHGTAVSHALFPFTKRETPIAVKMASLDEFLAVGGITLEPEVLIKLDVQGYEDRVIRGGARTFAAAKACISEIDFDPLYEGQCNPHDIWSLLERAGYRYSGNLDQGYAPDGHVVGADALFVR